MASTIQIRRTGAAGGTPGAIPALSEGELAVDLVNKVLYTANSSVTFELARNTANNGLVLHDGSGNEVTLLANSNMSTNFSLTLPVDDGTSGQFLSTDGNGYLSWGAPTGTVASVGDGAGLNDSGTASDPILDVNVGEGIAIVTDAVALKNSANFTDNTILKWNDGSTQLTDSLIVDDGSTVTVGGNLTVSGTTTTIDVATVSIQDPILKLANNNVTDGTVDIGFYGRHAASLWSGLYRDASDATGPGGSRVWKITTDMASEPGTAFSGGSLAQLDAVIDGGTF
jgi:hypothetical protein